MLYGVPSIGERIDALLEQFDLARFRHTKCGVLSSGEQTRVCLAKAMLNAPRLLLLDEPTASLDPATAREVRAKIRDVTTDTQVSVLWTSHNMYEVEAVCDRVLFLSHGRVLLEGNPRNAAAGARKEYARGIVHRGGPGAAVARVLTIMRLTPIAAIVLRQLYLLRGGPTRVLSLVIWVAIDIILWGFMTKYLNTVTAAGFDFVPVLLGAVLMWDFFTRVMLGVTMAFFEDVWSRNFLNVFGSPISITEYLAGLVVSSIITSALGLAGHAGAGHGLVRAVVSCLRRVARPVPDGAVSVRHRARDRRLLVCAAVRTVGRVVRVADSGDPVAVRRRLLSDFDDADLDSVDRALCCRRCMSSKACARS